MSASHHPTDIQLRQHRAKKRNKLRARIAAAPAAGRAEKILQNPTAPMERAGRFRRIDGRAIFRSGSPIP